MLTRKCDQPMKKLAKSPEREVFGFLIAQYRFATLILLDPLVRTPISCIDATRAIKYLFVENHLFSIGYMVQRNLPENPVSINIEGNHIVTSDGVEYLHLANANMLLIH